MKKRIFSLLMVLALAAAMLIPAAVAEEVAVSTDPFEEITAEFSSATDVEPYMVLTKPTRVSGWVFMRWAPSNGVLHEATYPAKKELKVLKETTNWLMVQDEQTGDVGYLKKEYAAVESGEKAADKPLNPSVVENGKTDLGVIDINGAFSLQCKMAEGYTIQPVKSTSDQMIALVTNEDPAKPILMLSVAYDEAYAKVDRMNDMDDEALAVLEKTFTDMDPTVEISYGDTGLGTRLMIVRQSDSGFDYLDFLSVYKGYFVECVMIASKDVEDKTLNEDQIKMCVDFLTDLDFVPAEEAKAPEGRWLANLTEYDAEAGTVKAELKHGIPIDAATVEALKVGDTLTVGEFSETIEEIEKTEEGTLMINHGDELVKYGDEYQLLVNGYDYLEPFANLTLTIPDDLVFMDGIDPATGEPLDQPAQHTAAEFKTMLAEEETPGFAVDNVYVTFNADGHWGLVEREYAPWQ